MPKKSLDKISTPEQFNDSPITNILATKERNIFVINRTQENKDLYSNFDNLFNTFLLKLPENNVKKYVNYVFTKNIIYIGNSVGFKTDLVFSRLYKTESKLFGIVLDSSVLEIDIKTGDTSRIDDCIYASYFGLVRSAILLNKQEIAKNQDLHKLLCTYLYHIFIRAIGQKTIYNEKQKSLVRLACTYIYYRQFLTQTHNMTVSLIKRYHSELFNKNDLDEFIPLLDNVSKYNTVKDIPKILVDLNVYHDNPSNITIQLIRIIESTGYYSLIGSLDQLIGMVILSKYPTQLFSRSCLTIDKIHDSVEIIISKFIDTIQFEKSKMME